MISFLHQTRREGQTLDNSRMYKRSTNAPIVITPLTKRLMLGDILLFIPARGDTNALYVKVLSKLNITSKSIWTQVFIIRTKKSKKLINLQSSRDGKFLMLELDSKIVRFFRLECGRGGVGVSKIAQLELELLRESAIFWIFMLESQSVSISDPSFVWVGDCKKHHYMNRKLMLRRLELESVRYLMAILDFNFKLAKMLKKLDLVICLSNFAVKYASLACLVIHAIHWGKNRL